MIRGERPRKGKGKEKKKGGSIATLRQIARSRRERGGIQEKRKKKGRKSA